jgi:enoyl-[acyl-carrier-protein] reductase (NADH)
VGSLCVPSRGCFYDCPTLMAPVRAGHPLRRYTNDEEVSNTIVFFSDLAPSITGQTLYIDGGLTA